MKTILLALALSGGAPADTAALTQLRIAVDRGVFDDVRASTYLPDAYGAGFLAGPAEVRLCGRLTCVVFVPADSAGGVLAGDVVIGVRPVSGSALAERLAAGSDPRARVAIVEPPPPPDWSLEGDALPLMYYLESAIIAVPLDAMPELNAALRSAGADVFQEGQGIVASFPNQVLRLVPAFAGRGPERLAFRLRREAAGDPTFRFGPTSRLRFGPGRVAAWTF